MTNGPEQKLQWQTAEFIELRNRLKNNELSAAEKLGVAHGESVQSAYENSQAILDKAKRDGMPESLFENLSEAVRDLAVQAGFHTHIDETFNTTTKSRVTADPDSGSGATSYEAKDEILKRIGAFNGSIQAVFPEEARVALGLPASASAREVMEQVKDLREYMATDPTITGLGEGERLKIEMNLEEFLAKAISDDGSFGANQDKNRDESSEPHVDPDFFDTDQSHKHEPVEEPVVDANQNGKAQSGGPIFRIPTGVLRTAKAIGSVVAKGTGLLLAYGFGSASIGTPLAPFAGTLLGASAIAAAPVVCGLAVAGIAFLVYRKMTR